MLYEVITQGAIDLDKIERAEAEAQFRLAQGVFELKPIGFEQFDAFGAGRLQVNPEAAFACEFAQTAGVAVGQWFEVADDQRTKLIATGIV